MGGVELDLRNPVQVHEAYRSIERATAAVPGIKFEGCLVQEMIDGQIELVITTHWDAQFGAMISVGMGGFVMDLLDDAVPAPAPVDAVFARLMLERLRGAPLLHGYRGRAKANVAAIAETVARVSQLAAVLGPRLIELKVNPLVVSTERAVVADAVGVLAE